MIPCTTASFSLSESPDAAVVDALLLAVSAVASVFVADDASAEDDATFILCLAGTGFNMELISADADNEMNILHEAIKNTLNFNLLPSTSVIDLKTYGYYTIIMDILLTVS